MESKLKQLESIHQRNPVKSVTVRYGQKEVTYSWDQRNKIVWRNVTRCRANYANAKFHIIDGDACDRPGVRLK